MDTQGAVCRRSSQEFLQAVKRTFDQALEDPPEAHNALLAPAEGDPSAALTT
jgi:hypothetical protein